MRFTIISRELVVVKQLNSNEHAESLSLLYTLLARPTSFISIHCSRRRWACELTLAISVDHHSLTARQLHLHTPAKRDW